MMLTGQHSRSLPQQRCRWLHSSLPLRVCHLGNFYPLAIGGIETHVQALAGGRAELGAKVRVLCVNHLDRHGRDVTWGRFAQTKDLRVGDLRGRFL